jgi:hypothetical protein
MPEHPGPMMPSMQKHTIQSVEKQFHCEESSRPHKPRKLYRDHPNCLVAEILVIEANNIQIFFAFQ